MGRVKAAIKTTAPKGLVNATKPTECPVRHIQPRQRAMLREVARLGQGKALLKALWGYYEVASSEKSSYYDSHLADLVTYFDKHDHEKELQGAFTVMRELLDDVFYTQGMREELHAEFEHVLKEAKQQ